MNRPSDYNRNTDHTVTTDGCVVGYMHARHWGDASSRAVATVLAGTDGAR